MIKLYPVFNYALVGLVYLIKHLFLSEFATYLLPMFLMIILINVHWSKVTKLRVQVTGDGEYFAFAQVPIKSFSKKLCIPFPLLQ